MVFEKLKNMEPYIVDETKYSIRLDANESFINLDEDVKNEIAKRIKEVGFNRYPDSDSTKVCKLYADYCKVSLENVIAGNGSDELINILLSGVLDSGDKILTLNPDFSMYSFYASLVGAKVLCYPFNDDMTLDIDGFIKKANEEKVKLIIFSNPNNPNSTVMEKETLKYIIKNTEALVVVDEAYWEFHGVTVVNEIDNYKNLIVLRTTSKAIGLPATRLGFLICNKELMNELKKVKPPYNLNTLTQIVGEVVLSDTSKIAYNVNKIIHGRKYLFNELKDIEKACSDTSFKVFNANANFIYIKCKNHKDIYEELKKRDILIRCFKDALRVCVGTDYENEKFIEALRDIILKK